MSWLKPEPDHLVELLRRRSLETPERQAYVFLADGEREEATLTYAELDRQARRIGAALQDLRMAGERVLLLYPPGLHYISAFFGCLYAGAIAVPAYPPRSNRHLLRLRAIAADARAVLALTTEAILGQVRSAGGTPAELAQVRWLATPLADAGQADGWREPAITGGTLAFLQYTSGSTADPKGVMVSHANLLYNERMIQLAYGHSAATVFAGWLPLYHDMGLIGNVLQPLFLGIPSILMPPVAFLQQPVRWLRAISRYRATTSGGPDFSYRLCAQRIPPAEREHLDLSSWSVAFNGAEPVRAETLAEFADAFSACGFRRDAFRPCYGLAEATLLASGGARAARPTIHAVSGSALGKNRVVAAAAGDAEVRRLVGCGTSWLEQRIVIAEPESLTRCPPGRVGEIWLAGPNVAGGYWGRAEETARTFGARLADSGEGPYLRTGDLGFLRDGELFVCGRLKDLIILRGVNHYPQDIERTAELSHPGLAAGANAAFSIEAGGEERLVLVQEVRRDYRRPDVEEVGRAIRRAVSEAHEAQVYGVVLIRSGSLARTSSGKVQRRANRAAFLAGDLREIGRSMAAEAAGPAPASAEAGGDGFLRRALRALRSEAERRALLLIYLQEQAARALRLPVAQIEPGAPLTALGLDSLAAIELQNLMESGLGVALPAASLLAGPTLEELAAEALARFDAPSAAPIPPPVSAPAGEPGERQPLSHGQRALWYLSLREPASPAYNVAVAVVVEGPLDREALRSALAALAERHPALRTRFGATLGEPWQEVLPRVEVPVAEEDAAGWDAGTVDRRLAQEAYFPFDLASAPLLRVRLFAVGSGETVLLLVMHHLVTDFWSLAVFFEELGEIYGARRAGARPHLPPLAVRYGDFVRWEAERLAGSEGERLWSFWRGELAGELPILDLPTDHPRPAVQTFRGASRAQALDGGLSERLEAVGRSCGATLYMTLLAALQVLLHRYTGQRDLLVGTPMAGRGRAELSGVIGYFANPVVLRGGLAGDPSFNDLLAWTRLRALAAFAHQDFPFALLVERLQPERDPSRSPLFQVLFVLQKAQQQGQESLAALALGETRARQRLGGLSLRAQPLEEQVAQLDLRLWAASLDGALLTSWQYNRDLFEAATIARLGGHFETLLRGVVEDPTRPLADLPLLTAGEARQLLAPPAERAEEAAGQCVHHLFEAQAERSPEAVAVSFEGRHLSYRELDRRANRLAHHLMALGVGPEVRVGLSLEPTGELVVAILAILKAGGAYVPLDPSYPPERLAFVLEDAGVAVLVTESRLLSGLLQRGLPPPRAEVVRLDEDGETIARCSAEAPGRRAVSGNAVYVIFTSGSSGRPKGVVVAHRHVVRLFSATRHWYGFGAGDVFTLFHSFAFDVSVWELWGALLHGGRLIVLPYWLVRTPEALYELLEREGVTVLCQTPSAFRPLLQVDASRPTAGNLALRWIIFAGEALELRSLRPWFARHGDRAPVLVNMYGITETLVHATFRPLRRTDGERVESLIGEAIPDLQLVVLDREGQPVPVGVTGELYVGGAGLARGYLERPALTGERFVPNPFHELPGERLYRSGDLVRRRADGDLEYLGRADQQVKIRGFRVELGEIESILADHPAVERAVVVAAADAVGGRRLVAYVVCPRGAPAAVELRAHLRGALPDYMLPAVFVPLDAMPLTPSGKVNRRALPAPELARPEREAAYVAPRNRLEAELAAIWCEVLGLPQVGVTDNFFALGGDSILSIQVVARAHQRGFRVTPRQAFEHQTIAELAAVAVAADRAGDSAGAATAAGGAELAGEFPLTPMQQGLLFHSVYEPGLDEYLVQVLCRFAGPLDAEVLRQAWRLAAVRHPVLRTAFRWQGLDEAVQVVHAAAEPPWRHEDWRALPAETQEERLAALLAVDRRCGFDLAAPPLLRLALARLAGEDHQLVVTFHHLILDGWSTAVLLKEVLTAYAALRAGRAPELPPAPPFRDYLAWLDAQDQGRAEAFWRRLLQGFEAPTPLPADRPLGAFDRPSAYAEHRLALPPDTTAALAAFARRYRLTQSTLVQAAWGVVLARHAGENDVVFGVTVAGRPAELPGVESMLGLLINTLPVRLSAAREQELLPWLGSLQAQLVELRQHEHSALGAVQRWSEVPRGQALFDSAVIFESYPLDRSLLAGGGELALRDVRSVEWSHYPLSLTALPGNELALQAVYDQRRFDATTALRLLGSLETFLADVAAAKGEERGRRLGDVTLLTPAQEQQVRCEWNDSRTAVRADACLHERIAEMAAWRGDFPAVEEPGTGRRWTYRELDGRANRLAQVLRAQGVGPEVLVGLCVERRQEMVAAHLAILKAGGGCLPLDPGYPPARLALMLADGGVPVLITEPHLLALLPENAARVVLIGPEGSPGEVPGEPPASGVLPANVAHVIYTSGSTGVPKAVVMPHRSLARFADTAIRLYDLRPGDRVLQFGSISFDAAIEEIYCCLMVGGTLVLRDESMLASPASFLAECAALGITVLDLPTAFWHQLCAALAAGAAPPAGLRSVIIAGERAAPEHLADWLRHAAPGTLLTNAYGPAEGTIVGSTFALRPGGEAGREVPVGRPIANVRVHLLDRESRPVPIGGVGELHLGGDGVTRGYLRRPGLTAERFVPDPLGGAPGDRLYKTGDLARHLADGTLELVGRIDQQVKLRGFRVELGEVESVLLEHPAVQLAVVQPWRSPGGDLRLVAYVVAAQEAPPPSIQELRLFLLERLPPYMVPAHFQLLASLPLTASGSKVDRRALPPPEETRPELTAAYVAPRSEVERLLAEIWSQVLGVEPVGLADSFFELGGDSILSLQAVARAHQAGLRFTPKQLFECQTIGELARVVELDRPAPVAEQGAVTGEMPLTPIQEWFFSLGLPRPEHWNQAVLLTVAPGDGAPGAEPCAWQRAIAALVEHHDALRFAFPPPVDGRRWARAVAAPGAVPFAYCDLTALPPALQGTAVTAAAGQAQASLFFTGPLLRAVYFDLGAKRPARLLLAIHHLVVDGVSWRILLEDLAAVCRQLRRGEVPRLPPKTDSFKRWSETLAEHAATPELAAEAAHWLALAPPYGSALPLDFEVADPAGVNLEAGVAAVRTALGEEETRALLREVPAAYGTDINDALLAALLRAVTAWTGRPALLLELEGHGREPLFEHLDVSRTVGWFTTAFPVLLELPPEDDPGAVLKAVKERLRAVPGRGIGYGLLRYLHPDAELRRQLARLPRPAVGFNYLGQLDAALGGGTPFALAPEGTGASRDPDGARSHWLEVEGRVAGGRLELEWLYHRRLHRASTIARLADSYLAELRALIAHCRSRQTRGYTPSDFPQMRFDQGELDSLLNDLASSLEGGA